MARNKNYGHTGGMKRNYLWDIFYTELVDIVGKEHVLTSEADKLAYSNDVFWIPNMWIDRKMEPFKPDYIVQPGSREEVIKVLKLANRERVPVTPWGGGSGSQGGILPVYGGIMLDLKRLNRIIEIDELSHTVTVEAGINNTLLEKALNERGYTFPHYPASSNCASVGGFIAHRGSGTLSTKYGKIEDLVVSLEVVLPTGEVMNTLPVPKHASGPGLHEFFTGCEGTLGIVTKATLIINELPQERRFGAYLFKSLDDGLEAGRLIMVKGLKPTTIRLYDPESTRTKVGDVLNIKVDDGKSSYMIVGYDGDPEFIDYQEKMVDKICSNFGAKNLGSEPGEHWWKNRYKFYYPPYEFRLPWMYGTMDTVCLFKHINKLYYTKKKTLEESFSHLGLKYIAHFSHWYKWGVMVYDRFIIEDPPQDPLEAIKLHNEIWNKAVRISIENGGVINEHHGIGLKLGRFMGEQYGDTGYGFLTKVKEILDPNGILNPGKMGFGPVK
ncbi:MAG: FAD-binding oxidoreductase [Mahellales bacterium]